MPHWLYTLFYWNTNYSNLDFFFGFYYRTIFTSLIFMYHFCFYILFSLSINHLPNCLYLITWFLYSFHLNGFASRNYHFLRILLYIFNTNFLFGQGYVHWISIFDRLYFDINIPLVSHLVISVYFSHCVVIFLTRITTSTS